MPLLETKGAASAQGFGLSLSGEEKVYIEDVFSTWLYTGNGSTQTITNGIDLSTKGGLVWIKRRNDVDSHCLQDSARGFEYSIYSDAISNSGLTNYISSVNSSGFSLSSANTRVNGNTSTYVSWTFRKQPKFFDVVTYTGNGSTSGRTISHNLGSVPGCIIVKKTSSAEDWYVYHRSLGNTGTLQYFCILNSTAAQDTGGFGMEKASNWTATQFALASGTSALNTNGETYVAYLFAHNAGGFGLSGTDNVISCGITDGSKVTLGWEPQWILHKSSDFSDNWNVLDTMRGMPWGNQAKMLNPNLMNAEAFSSDAGTAYSPKLYGDGFELGTIVGTHIYIAIRRGPMKVPTSGTSVFNTLARSGNNTTTTITSPGFAPDSVWVKSRSNAYGWYDWDKLRGVAAGRLQFNTTGAEQGSSFDIFTAFTNTGYTLGPDTASGQVNANGSTYINYAVARAPGFFDVVCYTGTGANATQAHNLSAVPQMMIVKKRSATSNWAVYHSALGAVGWILLNSSAAASSGADFWQSTTPTAVNFYIGTNGNVGDSGQTYVAYLFATCAGVSKVGSYTGTGALQTVNCGFTGGARFVLIKRTDSTDDWYVYDSARGISSGNDPYLLLNSTAAEVTATNYVDTTSVGFQVTAAAPAGLNANGGTYIFLAIA